MNMPKLPYLLRSEEAIISTWQGDITKPLVSVQCITFNHAPFIEDALKGFLSQETDFPIEVWIHDDASTDGTREIVESYNKRYPKIIKTILQDENQYSKGKNPTGFLLGKVAGKYIAFCEGDDYWTDPQKLQIQVDFLECNPGYVISGHDAFIIDGNGDLISNSKLPETQKKDFEGSALAEGTAWILTMSWVYRNILSEYAPERNMVRNGDNFFLPLIGEFGKSHYHDDIIPAAYRVHPGGVWSALSDDNKLDDQTNTWFWMYKYYKRMGKPALANIYYSRFRDNVFRKSSWFDLFRALLAKALLAEELKGKVRNSLGPQRVMKLKRVLGRI